MIQSFDKNYYVYFTSPTAQYTKAFTQLKPQEYICECFTGKL